MENFITKIKIRNSLILNVNREIISLGVDVHNNLSKFRPDPCNNIHDRVSRIIYLNILHNEVYRIQNVH